MQRERRACRFCCDATPRVQGYVLFGLLAPKTGLAGSKESELIRHRGNKGKSSFPFPDRSALCLVVAGGEGGGRFTQKDWLCVCASVCRCVCVLSSAVSWKAIHGRLLLFPFSK